MSLVIPNRPSVIVTGRMTVRVVTGCTCPSTQCHHIEDMPVNNDIYPGTKLTNRQVYELALAAMADYIALQNQRSRNGGKP